MTIEQTVARLATTDIKNLVPALMEMFSEIATYSPSEAVGAYQTIEVLESLTPSDEKVSLFLAKLKKAVRLRMDELRHPNEIHRISADTYKALVNE